MPSTTEFSVFADLNCPFCHALSERFHALEMDGTVIWRPIQHAPTISSNQCSYDILCELASEVAEVRRRSPDAEIQTPSFRPNSRLASETLAEAYRLDVIRASALRVLLYRALWLEGLDISDDEVLQSLVFAAGFKPFKIHQKTRIDLNSWQSEWEQGDYDGNIPITLRSDNKRLIGFPQQQDLDEFITAGKELESLQLAACVMKPKQKLLIFDTDAESIQSIISVMGDYEIQLIKQVSELHSVLEVNGTPDLLVIDMDTLEAESSLLFRNLRATPLLRDIPIVLAAEDPDATREEIAFDIGASDFVRKPFRRGILSKRLSAQMEVKRSKVFLERMARIDALTGAFNRREFDTRLQTEWDRGVRSGSRISILMIDVDRFKEYNDNYGHHRGDECLKTLADILAASIFRPGDLLARYGGEEFVAILLDASEDATHKVAERCRNNVELEQIIHEHSSVADLVTVSIGCATINPTQNGNPLKVVDAADQALYEAKRLGRNRVIYAKTTP